jgi:hypothetical protein
MVASVNRFPLVVDSTTKKIEELPNGDNLNLTGNGISAVRDIITETNNTYSLGSSSYQWQNLWLAGSISSNSSSVNLLNTTVTTLNIGGAATTVNIGANTGTTTVNNDLTVQGNLDVKGTVSFIESTTTQVLDKNLELGKVASPTDTTADGGGITLKGATDKTFNWYQNTSAWTSSEKLSHKGLVPTSGTEIDQVKSITKSLTLTTDWQDTGISYTDLSTGTYMVQLFANDVGAGGSNSNEYYSGTMSWYAGSTNSSAELPTDEIQLHRAGASGDAGLYLRTYRSATIAGTNLKLQIYSNSDNPSASNYVFKFRRLM